MHVVLADHTDGNDASSIYVPIIGISLWSRIIEKHITLDRSKKGTDYYSSLEPEEFKKMTGLLKEALTALGSSSV